MIRVPSRILESTIERNLRVSPTAELIIPLSVCSVCDSSWSVTRTPRILWAIFLQLSNLSALPCGWRPPALTDSSLSLSIASEPYIRLAVATFAFAFCCSCLHRCLCVNCFCLTCHCNWFIPKCGNVSLASFLRMAVCLPRVVSG